MAINPNDLSLLLNQATVKLTGATNKGIKAELYTVLDEFFDISSSWFEKIPVDAIAFQHEYTVTPTEGRIVRLGVVKSNTNFPTNALYDASVAASQQNVGGWLPIPAIMPTLGTIILQSPPSNPAALHVWVIKNVSAAARDMVPIAPDWVLPQFGRYILAGVLGKMMASPNKSYTNDAQSVFNLKLFQEGISRARTAALASNTYGASAWCFPQQFHTRSQNGYLSVGNDRSF